MGRLRPHGARLTARKVVFNEQTRASGLVVPYGHQTMQLSKAIVVEVGDEVEGIEVGDVIVYHECEAVVVEETVLLPAKAVLAFEDDE